MTFDLKFTGRKHIAISIHFVLTNNYGIFHWGKEVS